MECTEADDTDIPPTDNPTVGGICTEYEHECQWLTPDGGICQPELDFTMDFEDYCSGDQLTEYYVRTYWYGSTVYDRCEWKTYDCNTYGAVSDYCDTSSKPYQWIDYTCLGSPGYCGYNIHDPDSGSSYCGYCMGSGYWNIGGDVSNCCGDDNNEYRTSCWDSSANGNCGGDTVACCNADTKCVDHNGACQSSGSCHTFGSGGLKSYCNSMLWEDPDESQTYCTASGCNYLWNIGGETDGSTCCGDDNGQYWVTEHSSTDAPAGYNSGDLACCNSPDKCADDNTCTAAGGTRGSIPFRGWCCNTGQESCSASYWYGGDAFRSACTAIAGSGRFDIGGEVAATSCCGDDSSEFATDCQKNANVVWSCSERACCNAASKCVDPDENVCVASGNTRQTVTSGNDQWTYCSNSVWYDCDDYESNCGSVCANGGTGGAIACGEVFGECSSVGESDCCGDDPSENFRTCVDSSANGNCGAVTQACCNAGNDCLDQNANCRTSAACYGSGVFGNSYCNAGSWEDPDEASSYCVASCDITSGDGGIGFNLGGDVSNCCGDDASEYIITETAGTDSPSPYNANTGTSCCDISSDCTEAGADICTATGTTAGTIPNRAYCGASNTWYGGDAGLTYCNAIVGLNYWSLGGEVAATVCCGDDANEFRRTETGGTDAPAGYNDGITTCCNSNTDCTYDDTCTASGSTSSPAIPGKAYCNAGIWEGGDAGQTQCNAIAGPARWNIGGEVAATVCCGDDSGEYNRSMKCDGYACTDSQSDDACCDQTNDCVFNSVCYTNGMNHPSTAGVTCVNGVWTDTAAPTTAINPNGGDFRGQDQVDFILTCTDTGGSNCDKSYYKVVNSTDPCGQTGFTLGVSGQVTCPFGETCNKVVCFYSTDFAGNQESVKQSNIFQLGIHPCMNKQCGDTCLVISGICDGDWGNCYTDGGCFLDCLIPPLQAGDERRWVNSLCGRTGSYKCANDSVCSASYLSCTPGGSSREVNGTWSSYVPPSGSYKLDDSFQITINGISNNPPGFTILTECNVNKPNGNAVYLDNWGSGNLVFSYTIQASDPEGQWTVDYCGLWSDFLVNEGWELNINQTDFSFIVDRTPPFITINSPSDGSLHDSNFLVNATVTDTWSQVSSVVYRWENGTNGPWTQMTRTAGTNFFTANFDISNLADGMYTIRVKANDTLGQESDAIVGVTIDVTPPSITITIPSSDTWYNSDFVVTATVTDLTGISGVNYRWENTTGVGSWVSMSQQGSTWTSTFALTSVKDGLYTFRVMASDMLGNTNNASAQNVGIDDELPASNILPLPAFITEIKFNISWTGSDNESGIDCYMVQYRYRPSGQALPTDWANISVNGQTCTVQTRTEFDAQAAAGTLPNNYTFYFRSLAKDVADNWEPDKPAEAQILIFIPVLTRVYAFDPVTGSTIPNQGKTSADRIITITAQNRTPSVGRLNFTLTYYNHSPASNPLSGGILSDTRNNAYSINLTAGPYPQKTQISYWVYAQTPDGLLEERNPPAPFYYTFTMYEHPLANFVPRGNLYLRLGRSDIIGIEVRNIQSSFDRVYLQLDSEYANFIGTNNQTLVVDLNPQEERIVYARLFPSGLEGYTLNLDANSLIADPVLDDADTLRIVIFMPADFPELNIFGICLLVFLSVLIYLKFVSNN